MPRPLFSTLAILLLLIGCSRSEFLYNNAAWFIEQRGDELLDLNEPQRSSWRQEIDAVMDRHRLEALPRAAVLLQSIGQHAETGLSETTVECLLDASETVFRQHAALGVDISVPVLLTLQPGQISHLERRLEERNVEFAEDHLQEDPGERHEQRVKRYVKRIERWTGPLHPEQQDLVAQTSREIPDIATYWLEQRRRRQQQLLQLLRSKPSTVELRTFLTEWWVNFASPEQDPEQLMVRAREGLVQLIARLDRTLDTQQREELVTSFSDLGTELAAIHTKGASPATSDAALVCTPAVRSSGPS